MNMRTKTSILVCSFFLGIVSRPSVAQTEKRSTSVKAVEDVGIRLPMVDELTLQKSDEYSLTYIEPVEPESRVFALILAKVPSLKREKFEKSASNACAEIGAETTVEYYIVAQRPALRIGCDGKTKSGRSMYMEWIFVPDFVNGSHFFILSGKSASYVQRHTEILAQTIEFIE